MKQSGRVVKILATIPLLSIGVGVPTFMGLGAPIAQAPQPVSPAGTATPQQAQDFYNLALQQYKIGNYRSVIDNLNRAVQLNPANYKMYNLRGIARVQVGDVNNAIADFSQAISLNPQAAAAYRNRGLARLRRVGEEPQVLADLQQAAALYRAQGQTEAYQQTLARVQELLARTPRSGNPTPTSARPQTLTQLQRLLETNECRRCNLQGVDLRGVNLLQLGRPAEEGVLPLADLEGANLSQANLNGAFLRGASFEGANLSGARLSALLNQANLSGADLSGANLSGAQLVLSNLEGANLRGANLSGANLLRANLEDTDLSETNLQGAILPDGRVQN